MCLIVVEALVRSSTDAALVYPVHLDVALNCLRRQANGLEFGFRDQMLLHLRVRRLMVATFEWRLSELNQKVQPRIRGLIHNQS